MVNRPDNEPIRCVDCEQLLEPGGDNGRGQCYDCAAEGAEDEE